MTRLLALVLIAGFAPALAAQEPVEPTEPPAEEVEVVEEAAPQEEAADDAEPEESETGVEDQAAEPEEPLTPEEEERRRKLDEAAAERAAKREERQLKREAKKLAEETKRAEKEARQGLKLDEQIAAVIAEGHLLLEEGKHPGARQRFEKADELERGGSYEARMGLAQTEFALQNFARAVQDAQRAFAVTTLESRKAEALTFAGTATLAARPRLADDSGALLPGAEMYERAALRFFMRAVAAAPGESAEALAHIEARFPTREASPQAARLLVHYLESDEKAEAAHAARVVAAYEAQLVRTPSGDGAVAVVGAITPPKRTGGPRVEFSVEDSEEYRRRVIISFEVNAAGEVHRVTILNSLNTKQDAAVVKALEQWTYEPAQLPGGQPIAVLWFAGVNVEPTPESPGPGR